jgi:aminoglycoside phosphotransferase family enzyme
MRDAADPPPVREPGLAAKVAFLRRAESYPGRVERVETIETHMSWLFLAGRDVYKLKKPYRHDCIDYATLAARRRNCLREVRLNRRLAPDDYLGTTRLTVDAHGRLRLDGTGRPVEWLVHMRRLPEAFSLEQRLLAGTVTPLQIGRVVARLVPLFRDAPRARWSARGYRRHLHATVAATATALRRPAYRQSPGDVEAVAAGLHGFIDARADLLAARVRERRIGEGHGDLRPEHVYLTAPPTIVDCIEFDRTLRLRDPVDELAFLAMECDRLGHPQIDAWLFAAYRSRTGDHPPRALVEFHKALNAFVRAKIAAWHLDDADTGPRRTWIAHAGDYLARARGYIDLLQEGGACLCRFPIDVTRRNLL